MQLIGQWRKYSGFRVATPGKRVCIHEDSNGDRLYAYVEPVGACWLAWYEIARPGEIEDRAIGKYDMEREAMAAVRTA